MFNARFQHYRHLSKAGVELHRSVSFRLPSELSDHIDAHFLTTEFPSGMKVTPVARPLEIDPSMLAIANLGAVESVEVIIHKS